MVRIEWTRPAVTDLDDIREYIARNSPRYAEVTVRKIKAAADRLADGPFVGHELPDLPDSPYRQILVSKYRIIYRVAEVQNRVFVVGVIHASRDLPPIMERR